MGRPMHYLILIYYMTSEESFILVESVLDLNYVS